MFNLGSFVRLGGCIAALMPVLLCFALCNNQSQVQFRTVPLEKGDISVEVTASGIINPHYLIQVGTQVSGTISHIFVDFNSRVKKGQLVALIDTTFLYAAVEDAAAARNKAQSQQNLTQNTAKRTKDLFDKGLAAQADLDQATADLESAKANLISAQAELDRAKINLAYARIVSPITGVVVNRNVDVAALSAWLAVRAIDRETRRLDSIERGEPAPPATPASIPPATPPSAATPDAAPSEQPTSDLPIPGPRRLQPKPKVSAPRPPAAAAPADIPPTPNPPVVSQQVAPLPPPIEVRPAPGVIARPPKPKPPLVLTPSVATPPR